MRNSWRQGKLNICYSAALLLAGLQSAAAQAPVLNANAKGPNQINLTWTPAGNPGYGYKVEIQSAGDNRYPFWTPLLSIPAATGYTCDSSIVWNGGRCNISDPTGLHVYNPPEGIPYWVTEPTYIDPIDGSRT